MQISKELGNRITHTLLIEWLNEVRITPVIDPHLQDSTSCFLSGSAILNPEIDTKSYYSDLKLLGIRQGTVAVEAESQPGYYIPDENNGEVRFNGPALKHLIEAGVTNISAFHHVCRAVDAIPNKRYHKPVLGYQRSNGENDQAALS